MTFRTSQPSPMVRNAARTILPARSRDADRKIQAIIEGRVGEPDDEHSNVTGLSSSNPSPLSPVVSLLPTIRGEHSQMDARVRQSQNHGLNRAS